MNGWVGLGVGALDVACLWLGVVLDCVVLIVMLVCCVMQWTWSMLSSYRTSRRPHDKSCPYR